jgi:hypothetical protein
MKIWLRRWQVIAVACAALNAVLVAIFGVWGERLPKVLSTLIMYPAGSLILALGCNPHTDRCGSIVLVTLMCVVPPLVWSSLIIGAWAGTAAAAHWYRRLRPRAV